MDVFSICEEFANRLQNPLAHKKFSVGVVSQHGPSDSVYTVCYLCTEESNILDKKIIKQRRYCQPKRQLTFRWKQRLACSGSGRQFRSSCTLCWELYIAQQDIVDTQNAWRTSVHTYTGEYVCMCVRGGGAVGPCFGKDTFNRLN